MIDEELVSLLKSLHAKVDRLAGMVGNVEDQTKAQNRYLEALRGQLLGSGGGSER